MSTAEAPPADTTTPAPAAAPSAAELNQILAKMAEFAQLMPQSAATGAANPIDFLRDVPVTITAQLGHVVLPIGEILKLGPGAVLELEELVSQPVQLTVRGVPFATGEVVVVEDRFAVRIKQLLPAKGGAKPA
ncbi:FliM/FliN family flagellar motor switch protein [Limnoglobus roseus]|uniref:Flagellar motor switch protein FliN n=1 Tax=Limnoglobus roseus TaxID=2598579 RepID=A0A5C1A3X6_9BACT|nr:FliM/FliN family flagellar motor switch protein [Limnoglobus roseus]QEL13310.1 flagellar motor switch protein FliN [Limnoglobus roseus]